MERNDQLEQAIKDLANARVFYKRSAALLAVTVAAVFLLGAAAAVTTLDGDVVITGNLAVSGTVNGVDVVDMHARIVPIGTVVPFAGTSVPEGWLLCDGREIEVEKYAALWHVLKKENSEKVNLPNLQGRMVVGTGRHEMAEYVLGAYGGKVEHILTEAQMPVHSHKHELALTKGPGSVKRAGTGDGDSLTGNLAATQSSGGGDAFPTMPPYWVLNYIIKY